MENRYHQEKVVVLGDLEILVLAVLAVLQLNKMRRQERLLNKH